MLGKSNPNRRSLDSLTEFHNDAEEQGAGDEWSRDRPGAQQAPTRKQLVPAGQHNNGCVYDKYDSVYFVKPAMQHDIQSYYVIRHADAKPIKSYSDITLKFKFSVFAEISFIIVAPIGPILHLI